MVDLDGIEKKQNIKFPKEFKELYQTAFKEMKKGIVIHAGDEVFHIRKFLTATEINDVLEEFYDFFGYDIIPIAETDSDDYMCLYYKKNRECPSVIYWDYELALINSEEAIFFLYDTMYELEEELR